MTKIRIIGVDPGLTCGIGVLDFDSGAPSAFTAGVLQCDSGMALAVIAGLIEDAPGHVGVACERYVAGRNREGGTASLTRSLVEAVARLAAERADVGWSRAAHEVKAWATDDRMATAGLLELAKGMSNHGLDGLRHAMYAAVKNGGLRDPLARKGSRKSGPPSASPAHRGRSTEVPGGSLTDRRASINSQTTRSVTT
jgi:hypothetical protein